MITKFADEYRFLSNFYPSKFVFKGKTYKTNEHFYQAHKTKDLLLRREIINLETPGQAKKFGAKIKVREDWDQVKKKIMWTGLKNKFNQNPDIAQMLLDTGDLYIQEGNYWGDTFWGVCLKTNVGENNLGRMLMVIRTRLLERGKV